MRGTGSSQRPLHRLPAGVNEGLMAAFDEAPGHRAPHDAEADEADLRHFACLPRRLGPSLAVRLAMPASRADLERDPEKWMPVFG